VGIEQDSPVIYYGDVKDGCEGSKMTAEVGGTVEGGYLEVRIEQWRIDGEEEGDGEMSWDSQYTGDEVTDDEDEDEDEDEDHESDDDEEEEND